MDKPKPQTTTEAIQTVILTTPLADYIDVVDEVEKQFGMKVSQREVEETYVAMKKHARSEAASRSEPVSSPPQKQQPNVDPLRVGRALLFVEEMGGFAQARAALERLEDSLKRLPK